MFDIDTTVFLLLAFGAFLSALLSGVAGMGGGLLYLPFLAASVGVRKAIPFLAVLLLVANIARAFFSRQELKWDVAARLGLGAVPGALIGALLYTALSAEFIARAVGVFLLLNVFFTLARIPWPRKASLKQFPYVGVVAGFLSAVVGGAGPMMTPFFLRLGIVKGAFLSTEAVAAASMHIVKIPIYSQARLLTLDDIMLALPLAGMMILGTWVGKLLVNRMNEALFRTIVTILLGLIGLRFLILGSG